MSFENSQSVWSLPRNAIILALGLALAACSSGGKPSIPSGAGGTYKIGKPYQIAGVWYYPKEDEKYDATGIASWYGPQFHNKKTANGETFDMEQLTAAHPTLPMPVLVRVTNLENGRSVVVRLNDRGPFVAGREIDLSRKAAELLGYEKKGTARVRVQFVGRAPLPGSPGTVVQGESFTLPPAKMEESERQVIATAPSSGVVVASTLAAPVGAKAAASTMSAAPLPTPSMSPIADTPLIQAVPDGTVNQVPVAGSTSIYVQAGSFQSYANAEAVRQKLLAQGVGNVQVSPTTVDSTQFYRVRVGPMNNVNAADASLKTIRNTNAGARIVVE
ncbi:MAG: septal ring lytic transglycosylase RlpA family protein [Parvibaculum sp.]|nr:septal ring lytic transglycosylase RlpA family protein [Parvibaculum sp.]